MGAKKAIFIFKAGSLLFGISYKQKVELRNSPGCGARQKFGVFQLVTSISSASGLGQNFKYTKRNHLGI
jgi:hypothetical protein